LQHLVLFHTGNDFALWGAPNDFLAVRHTSYIFGKVTPTWP
jgi:hypothetical protein